MKNYNSLCEMDIGELMSSFMGQVDALNSNEGGCKHIKTPTQPDDNIGQFGNESDIQIKETPEGGLEIDSKEMAFKLSSTIYDAIKSFINKGDE